MKYTSINKVLADKISGEWGVEPDDDCGVKVIRTANFTNLGVINFSNIVLRKIESKKIEQKKLISGDVIIEKSGGSPTQPVGRVVYFENPDSSIYLCNNFTTVLRPNKSIVFSKYLFYILFYNHLTKKTLRFQNKTTGIINLKLENYLKSEIPLPSLDDQIRIATVLTRAEKLIAKRKESIKALDEHLKSTFLEMFGDPVRNEKGWEKKPLGDCLNTHPQNGLYKHQSKYGNGTKIIRIDSFYDGYVEYIENLKRVDLTSSEIEQYAVKKDDILINRVNSMEYLGKVGVVPDISEDIVYESNMMRFCLNHELLTPIFLMFLWRTEFIKAQIKRRSKNAVNQSSINQQDVLLFSVLIPEKTLQNQFAAIVNKVEALKAKYTQSLSELENLYGSLSQRAFKGELDLGKLPVEEEQIGLHEEVITRSAMTDELSASKIYSEAELIKTIQSLAGDTFSFDSLITALEKTSFEELPKYEELKQQIYKMLEGAKPLLSQTFDRVKKEIVLRVKQ